MCNISKDDKMLQSLIMLRILWGLSSESERIKDPICDESKFQHYCECLKKLSQFVEHVQGKLEATKPDFPMCAHQIEITIPTDDPDLDLTEVKTQLADNLNSADEVSICVDNDDYIHIYLCWNDIYTPREA